MFTVEISETFKRSQFYLLCQYCLFSLIVGFQIARILYYRHALISFQLGFLLLCFIWSVLRIVFWSTVFKIGATTASHVLLWLPLNIQFATFSLLVVFYAHLVHKSTWEQYTKRRFAIAYIVINGSLLIMQCVILGMDSSDQSLLSLGTAIVFLVLVGILAWYGFKLHRAIAATAKHQMLFQVPMGLFPVTFIIVLLFASRSLYDFINVSNKWPVALDSDKAKDQLIIFFAYFMWEIVPAIMIIVVFWRIPTTHIGGITRRGRSTMFMLPPSAVQPIPNAVSRLFNDPQRYDSDDETSGLLHKNTPITYTTPPKPSSYTYSIGKNTPYATTPREEIPSGETPVANRESFTPTISTRANNNYNNNNNSTAANNAVVASSNV